MIKKVTICNKRRNKIIQITVDYIVCLKNYHEYYIKFQNYDPNYFSDHVIVNVRVETQYCIKRYKLKQNDIFNIN